MLNPIIDTLLMLESNSIFVAAWQMLHFCTNHLDFQRNRKELELLLTLFWAPATVFVVAEAVMCRGWLSWLNSSWGCFFESGSHNHENSTWRFQLPLDDLSFWCRKPWWVPSLSERHKGHGLLIGFVRTLAGWPWALEAFWSREARSWATSACTRASLPLVKKE